VCFGDNSASAGFFLGLIFDPRHGGNMSLWNVDLPPYYVALWPGKPHSSRPPPRELQIRQRLRLSGIHNEELRDLYKSLTPDCKVSES
jgi:hypothetical protein